MIKFALAFLLLMGGLFMAMATVRLFLLTAIDLARLPEDFFD